MIDQLKDNKYFKLTFTVAVFIGFGTLFLPFLVPLIFSGLFAFALYPIQNQFFKRTKKPAINTGLFLLTLVLCLGLPVILVINRVISLLNKYSVEGIESSKFFKSFEVLYLTLKEKAALVFENLGLDVSILTSQSELFSKLGGFAVQFVSNLVAQLPGLILSSVVFLAGLYFFLLEAPSIKKFFRSIAVVKREEFDQLITVIQESSYLSLVVTSVIGCIQASVVALMAYFFGYEEFLIIFVVTFISSFIPVIGAGPIAFLLSLVSFMQGSLGSGIALVITAVVVGTIDNFIKPLLMKSKDDGFHPVISLLGLVGAVMVYGFMGILLGPIILRLSYRIIPIFYDRNAGE